MSQSTIKDKTNLCTVPETGSVEGTLHPGSRTRIPVQAQVCTQGDTVDAITENSSSTDPTLIFAEDWQDLDPDQPPFDYKERHEFGNPIRSGVTKSKIDASESSNPFGSHNAGPYIDPPKMSPGGHDAELRYSPIFSPLPTEHDAGASRRRSKRIASLPILRLRSPTTEDADPGLDTISMAPFEPTTQTLPPDDKVPISPGPNPVESPPGLSHTINYWPSPDANIPRSHTHGSGPNAEGLTSPLRPRFFAGENAYIRSLTDERYLEEELRERTSRGNDVATQDARRAGVQQRDFAQHVERPRSSRGLGYTNEEGYYDPEEMNMVCVPEAMLMEQQQERRFAEYWEGAGLWQLWNLWLNP